LQKDLSDAQTDCGGGLIMTDNEFVDKYQNALSDLCGVDYAYMQGDPAVDTIVELIRLAVEQKAEIERLQKANERFEKEFDSYYTKVKSEARKKFAERLKGKLDISACGYSTEEIVSDIEDTIDNLLKEMEGK
jgi:hypothetical protein